MSKDLVRDMEMLHDHFGVHEAIDKLNPVMLKAYFKLRVAMLQEELDELKSATNDDDAVDALVDLAVFAIGTLEVMRVDANFAWDTVLVRNMQKEVGVKDGRPNPFGLPDLIKPEGWIAPTHDTNTGLLSQIYGE